MLDLTEVQEALQLALLGENWLKNQANRGLASSEGPSDYHAQKAERHTRLATYHQAAADLGTHNPRDSKRLGIAPSELGYHFSRAAKHRRLAVGHNSLRRANRDFDDKKAAKLASLKNSREA